MSEKTFKMTKLAGESPDGIEAAVATALATSTERVHGQSWLQVSDIRANIGDNGTVDRWQVVIEVGFLVEPS